MSADRNSERIVIAGASSLLGGELKTVLEESYFAGWDLRLVDEDVAAGTLTEAGGEADADPTTGRGNVSRCAIRVSDGFGGIWENLLAAGTRIRGDDH